eukprot:13950-Heterococcus_DN1.PRE.10
MHTGFSGGEATMREHAAHKAGSFFDKLRGKTSSAESDAENYARGGARNVRNADRNAVDAVGTRVKVAEDVRNADRCVTHDAQRAGSNIEHDATRVGSSIKRGARKLERTAEGGVRAVGRGAARVEHELEHGVRSVHCVEGLARAVGAAKIQRQLQFKRRRENRVLCTREQAPCKTLQIRHHLLI